MKTKKNKDKECLNDDSLIKIKFQQLLRWWNFHGVFMYRNFKIGVGNIVYWLPIIWNDRNWDSHYIFEILKHKLTAHANYIAKHDRHTRAQHDAKNMRLCVKLIKLVDDEFYESEHMDYHNAKYWFEPNNDNTNSSSWESKMLEENFDNYFAKYPLIYKRVLNGEGLFNIKGKEENKELIAMNIGNINQTRAHALLFKIMKDNILGWWD
jgi:hypothetical protein